ncbi:MAG: 3'(2'),5'-bisphosphate nucleotidase CysQ [Deltaproteobacteria bacterium]|nr:3'(2'),5'-bisphosphate nucleotidase CysQ [Deltaproteobacteria bacterium]MBW2071943.1 3'(2'),5'-bisphosphate nucleotidase CysQ [Deltaproteobacteria bacterium]
MTTEFLKHCLSLSLQAATKAGAAILTIYQQDYTVDYKEDQSPITLADTKAHSIIEEFLSNSAAPNLPILSEEGKHISYESRRKWDYFWLVDPLDGTKEFIKRRGEFTVNIALIHKGRPILGVVFVPARDLLYFAVDRLGAFRCHDEQTLVQLANAADSRQDHAKVLAEILPQAQTLPLVRPDNRNSLTSLRVVGSRSHGGEKLARFVEQARKNYHEVEFVPAGSALKFGLIAEGSADVYPRFGPTMEWDTAAGQCVVELSGGTVLSMTEQTPLRYNKKDLHNPYFCCRSAYCKDYDMPSELS